MRVVKSSLGPRAGTPTRNSHGARSHKCAGRELSLTSSVPLSVDFGRPPLSPALCLRHPPLPLLSLECSAVIRARTPSHRHLSQNNHSIDSIDVPNTITMATRAPLSILALSATQTAFPPFYDAKDGDSWTTKTAPTDENTAPLDPASEDTEGGGWLSNLLLRGIRRSLRP